MSPSAQRNYSGPPLARASRDGHAASLKTGDMQVTKKLEALQQTLG